MYDTVQVPLYAAAESEHAETLQGGLVAAAEVDAALWDGSWRASAQASIDKARQVSINVCELQVGWDLHNLSCTTRGR